MNITNIQIKIFRLLKNFSFDLEDNLSFAIGKNNTGKTSFLNLLEKFLIAKGNAFAFEDFSLDCQEEIIEANFIPENH